MAGTVSPTYPNSSQGRGGGETSSTNAMKTIVAALNAVLTAENKVDTSSFSFPTSQLSQSKLVWYSPKTIATEENRNSATFGFMTTEDKVENVVLAESGLIVLSYRCQMKSSVGAAGRAAIFLGSEQLKVFSEVGANPVVQETASAGTGWGTVFSGAGGLLEFGLVTTFVTTGQALASGVKNNGEPITPIGGVCYIFAAPGTYTVGVKYKATSGTVTAKNRVLTVHTLG